MRRTTTVLALLGFLFLGVGPAHASHVPIPRPAPAWDIAEWLNGAPATVGDFTGKVVIVEFFQLWCPGCKKFSIPLLKHWQRKFAKQIAAGDLTIVSIHTVFEGHDYQNPKRLRAFIKEKEIRHLVGIDRHKDGAFLPETMRRYGTRGTPEMAFIGKQGMVRFQKFGGFDVDDAETLLQELLSE